MTKRIVSLLFCIMFVLSSCLLASCGDDNETSGDVAAETEGFLEAKNWGGVEVNILCRDGGETSYVTYQADAEEPSDEPVINAFYRRNQFIKDNYGIDINVVTPESGNDVIQMLRTDMQSGNNEYQAIINPIHGIAPLASDGLLTDFNSLTNGYIRLNETHWDQALIKDVVINDKVFFLNGDALVQDDESTWVMFFNKDLIEQHSLENPYELVYNNQWTIDKMYEMLKNVELTHGTVKSYDPAVGDQWGMVVQSYDFYQFMMGCDQRMIDNTGDVPVLRIEEQENVTTFTNIANWFIFDSQNIGVADYHGRWDSGVYGQETQIFANGNALFMPNSIGTVGGQNIRESEINYGLLPMPKRSDLQENYTSGINAYSCDVICVPMTNVGEKLDATCYALEAMAFFGKQLVTPEYYDRTLAHKRLKDDDSVEMLNIIFGNRIYDMGSVINFNAGTESEGTLYFYTDLLGDKSNNIISWYNTRKGVYQTGIDALIAQCYN